MASGHALSVLSRAYSASLRREYLERAFRALELFTVPSGEGGFQAKLLDTHIWYEEYPTSPPTFVLNGFMYSLLGLYDLRDALETHELTGWVSFSNNKKKKQDPASKQYPFFLVLQLRSISPREHPLLLRHVLAACPPSPLRHRLRHGV